MSATFSGFITTKYIKDNSPALGYVNDDELRTCIRPAQDIYIKEPLGTLLYWRLMNGINQNNLNADEITLLKQYIQPALLYWTLHEWVLMSAYKLTNKSLSKQNSDNSEPSDFGEVNYFKNNLRHWAQYYTQDLINYLKDNFALYPEYYGQITGYEEKSPNNKNFYFGIYIPSNRWDICPEPTPWDSVKLLW